MPSRGAVTERIRRVVSAVNDPTVSTPIRFKAPSHEISRPRFDNGTLPLGQRYVPSMLAPRAVLRKHLWPDRRVTGHHSDRTHPTLDFVDPSFRHDDLDGMSGPCGHIFMFPVQVGAQRVGPSYPRDVSVAQIHPQKVRIGRELVLVEGFEPPLYPF
jgi:hypothetical protein